MQTTVTTFRTKVLRLRSASASASSESSLHVNAVQSGVHHTTGAIIVNPTGPRIEVLFSTSGRH